MVQYIKHATNKISWTSIVVGFCLGILVFMVRQNSATASTIMPKPNYSSDSMTQFIVQKTSNIINDKLEKTIQDYNQRFDLISDYSLQKYISDEILLKNKNYTPSDLSLIDSQYVVNRAGRPYLRRPAQLAFESMANDFFQQTHQQFYLISAYRTFRDQATMFERGCSLNRCAKIGGSEHILGLAVDIHVATKNGYNKLNGDNLERMKTNAYKYGFINTYNKGLEVDGKMPEVWHWRYVGIPLATKLQQLNLSFAQYYNLNLDQY